MVGISAQFVLRPGLTLFLLLPTLQHASHHREWCHRHYTLTHEGSLFERVFVFLYFLFSNVISPSVRHQYSEKEDKYEEEIKVLTDKLKEVR